MAIQFLRGTASQNDSYTGPEGSISIDLTNLEFRLHDGTTAGGKAIGAASEGGAVDSVNGATGDVVLDSDDIAEGSSNLYYPSEDADKLAGIEEGAEVNAVTSVSGKTGAVSLSSSDVGLGNVNNYDLASQSEAEAASSNSRYMTPLRVKNLIEAGNFDIDFGTL